jgi:uroporphyrin-III C-methyltransferase/precorrin-2 dehydrogenase/sirohydrochlorin ferrochelatase
MHSLPLFLRLTGRPAILLGEGEAADAKRRLLQRAGAIISTDESATAGIAIIALHGAAAEEAAARLRARGIWINVVDRPDLCDFTMPAIVDRDPVLVAVSTGGASAGLAKALRQRIEALLPPHLGALATALQASRVQLRARWPDTRVRRDAIDQALQEGGTLDPLRDDAVDRISGWMATGAAKAAGRIEHIRLPSTDPDDLTLRVARLLGRADAIWHRGDVPIAILDRARVDAERHIADVPPSAPDRGLILWLEMTV